MNIVAAPIPGREQAGSAAAPAWQALDPPEVAARLDVSLESGLGSEEAARRLVLHGPNALQAARRISPWRQPGPRAP